MINGGQEISIGRGCEYKGIVQHEILHALGRVHEQSREDRDKYVTINFNNIIAGTQNSIDACYLASSLLHGPKLLHT